MKHSDFKNHTFADIIEWAQANRPQYKQSQIDAGENYLPLYRYVIAARNEIMRSLDTTANPLTHFEISFGLPAVSSLTTDQRVNSELREDIRLFLEGIGEYDYDRPLDEQSADYQRAYNACAGLCALRLQMGIDYLVKY